MAGDWIKMRGNLWDDPRVVKVCDLTGQGEAAVIGALYWLWATADQHTEDGILPGLTGRSIDRKTGLQGFADALVQIGWLSDHPEGVRIINFEEHNGASAKRRSLDAQRKANSRSMSASNADNMRTDDGQNAPDCGAREEKRREEINTPKRVEAPKPAARACSFAVNSLPPDWKAFCLTERPDLDPERTFAKFGDYWRAKPGKDGRKTDWLATWRNWVRAERAANGNSGASGKFNPHAYGRKLLAETLAAEGMDRGPASETISGVPGQFLKVVSGSGND